VPVDAATSFNLQKPTETDYYSSIGLQPMRITPLPQSENDPSD
jgi:hypothetical protein